MSPFTALVAENRRLRREVLELQHELDPDAVALEAFRLVSEIIHAVEAEVFPPDGPTSRTDDVTATNRTGVS